MTTILSYFKSVSRTFSSIPISVASYSDYIFKDLRIDENVLETLLKYDRMVDIEKAYSTRKVSWLMEYLTKHFKFK